MCPVKKDGTWGIVGSSGTVLLPPTYTTMEIFDQGFLAVTEGVQAEYIDRKFKVVWRQLLSCSAGA